MTASRSPGSDTQQGPHSEFASEVPPTLFRLRTVHPQSSASAAASSGPAPESGPAVDFNEHDPYAMEADSFPAPPTVAAGVDDFPPPPVRPLANEPTENARHRGHREPHGQRASGERHQNREPRDRQPQADAPAGRSWTEMLGSRLVLVMLLALAVGVFFVLTRNPSDEAIRLAEQDNDQLLAELGIGDISTGTVVSEAELAASDEAASLPESPSGEPSFAEQDPLPNPLEVPATAGETSPTAPQWAGNAELAASENPSSTTNEEPASIPAGKQEAAPSIDWDAEAGLGESGRQLDPAVATANGEATAGAAGMVPRNEQPTIREPRSINEPTPAGELDLVAPQSPYDSRLSQENPRQSHSAMTPGAQSPRGEDFVNEPKADTPQQTAMPYAVTDWSRYFPPESNPAVGNAGLDPYPYGAAGPPAAVAGQPAYGTA